MKLGQVDWGLRFDAATDLFAAQAEVRDVARSMPEKFKRADEELMRLARAAAPDPSVFEANPPTFLPNRISTKALDAYFTRMHISTLRNFAAEAREGRAFLVGHNSSGLPVGYSLTGDVEEISDEDGAVYSYSYVTPGRDETENFIKAYKSGVIRDVSVGFYGGKHICSICKNDLWDYSKCSHWPGRYYKVGEEQSDDEMSRTAKEELCFAWVHDAHLSEYSAVYDGATPGAVILKAQRQIAEGLMDARTVHMLNQRYRSLNLQLPARQLVPVGANLNEERTMATDTNKPSPAPQPAEDAARQAAQDARTSALAEVRGVFDQLAADLLTEEERKLDPVPQLRLLVTKLQGERTMAALGRKARTTAIDEAIKEGVRAVGDGFDEKAQRTLLETLSAHGDLTMVETMRANWAAQADNVLPKGRQSKDEAERAAEGEAAVATGLPLPASVWG